MHSLQTIEKIPRGTHNVQFYQNQLLYNDTQNNQITLRGKERSLSWNIPVFSDEDLSHRDIPKDHARQAFGRGLCTYGDWIIGGSSPATISVYSIRERKAIKVINLSKDIRNAIHGLEIWKE